VKGCSAQQASGGLDCAAGETVRNSAVHLGEYYACDANYFTTTYLTGVSTPQPPLLPLAAAVAKILLFVFIYAYKLITTGDIAFFVCGKLSGLSGCVSLMVASCSSLQLTNSC